MSEPFTIRPAVQSDGSFLGDMVVEAANWRGSAPRARHEILTAPEHRRYISGWMRPADAGFVATDPDGIPVGAAWYRMLSREEPGFGFIDTAVPELIIGVLSIWRAQGVGRMLLHTLVGHARAQGHRRLSLSVEKDNFARYLYRSEGFVTLEGNTGRDTMVHRLV